MSDFSVGEFIRQLLVAAIASQAKTSQDLRALHDLICGCRWRQG